MYFVTDFKDGFYCILNEDTGVKEWYKRKEVLELGKIVKINGVSENDIKITPIRRIFEKYYNGLNSRKLINPAYNLVSKYISYANKLGIKLFNVTVTEYKEDSPGYFYFPIGSRTRSVIASACSEAYKYCISTNKHKYNIVLGNEQYDFFEYIAALDLELPIFDTSNLDIMIDMFDEVGFKTLDLSFFDTSNVTSMSRMFWKCKSLQSLNLSSFDTSNVKKMHSMFAFCSSLQSLDLSSFDTSNVKSMGSMFSCCDSLQSLDLSSFNTSNVTNMKYMFAFCSSLQSLDLSSFDTSSVTSMENMFINCFGLKTVYLSEKCLSLRKVIPDDVKIIVK